MTIDEQLKIELRKLAGKGKQLIYFGQVKKVDTDNLLCDIEIDGLLFEKIGISFYEKNDTYGIAIIPKNDTAVMLLKLNENNEYKIIDIQEIEQIKILTKTTAISIQDKKISIAVDQTTTTITDSKIEINADEIVFNGGDNKGLVKIEKMVDWMSKVYQDLQTLKSTLANISTVSTIIAPAGVAGGPCSGVLSINFNPNVPNPQVPTFENDKIKH